MVSLEFEGRRRQVKGENAGETTVHSLFGRGEIGAFPVAHVVGKDRLIHAFMHLRKHVFKRQGVDGLTVFLDGSPRRLLAKLAAQGVIVVEAVVTIWQVKP